MKQSLLLLVLLLLNNTYAAQSLNDKYAIPIRPDGENTYVMTNGNAGFWYGNANNAPATPHMGWTISEDRILGDFEMRTAQNTILPKGSADSIIYKFDGIYYYYPDFQYQIVLIDSADILLCNIDKNNAAFSFRSSLPLAYENPSLIKLDENIFRLDWEHRKSGVSPIAHLYIMSDRAIDVVLSPNNFVDIAFAKGKSKVIFYASPDLNKNKQLERLVIKKAGLFLKEKRDKKLRLLERSYFACSDKGLTKAAVWAKISVNDLIMNQNGRGIFAGLPWFNNYWGRDTFISFTGAILIDGLFTTGREILDNFGRLQNRDKSSKDYGRIPNRITMTDVIYNTADGTPWFLYQLMNYLKYGGDSGEINHLFEVLARAIEGTLANNTDEKGFLLHADADTWMDAKGADGPWSPRGNRAVEIQVLWIRALEMGIQLAKMEKQDKQYHQWQGALSQVKKNFMSQFENEAGLYDHLNVNDSPDPKIRPNQIFAISLHGENVIPLAKQQEISQNVFEKLVYPYGVSSLYSLDPNFHPWHHYQPYYVQDAAYHNGIIWTWLSGPVITALAKFNQTENMLVMLRNEASQIIAKGAIGTQSELLDALPRLGKAYPDLSGTVSQAWNLAEFNRNIHEDFMGVRPDLLNDKIQLSPRLDKSISWAQTRQIFGNNDTLSMDYSWNNNEVDFNIHLAGKKGINVSFYPPQTDGAMIPFFMEPHRLYQISLVFGNGQLSAKLGNREFDFNLKNRKRWSFARPYLDVTLKALHGPEWPLLTGKDIRYKSESKILYSLDSVGDELGFEYPSNPLFKEGIFDIHSLKISEDDIKYNFEFKMQNLVNTGFNRGMGFDLTFLAVALNVKKTSTRKNYFLNRNSGFSFEPGELPEYVLFIGKGLLLVSGKDGKEICEYQPSDDSYQPGNADDKAIRFAIPKKYLKNIDLSKSIYILSGILDDHGGDRIGEFGSIMSGPAKRWSGGGKTDKLDGKNYFDIQKIISSK